MVIQRVKQASVTVDGKMCGKIESGLLVLAGFEDADVDADLEWMAGKIVRTRIFADEAGVMNRDIVAAGGEILAVSQFTLYASVRKGNRPSWSRAARGVCLSLCSTDLSPGYQRRWASRWRTEFLGRICRSA